MKGGAERKGVHVPCGSPLFNPVEHVFFDTLIFLYDCTLGAESYALLAR